MAAGSGGSGGFVGLAVRRAGMGAVCRPLGGLWLLPALEGSTRAGGGLILFLRGACTERP